MPSENALASEEERVRSRPLPYHVGIIMDGNGRWAQAREMPRVEGHRMGSDAVREVTRCARRIGVKALTLYAFSSQNWARPPEEVAALMGLLTEYLDRERSEILENGIRLNAIGELARLPSFVREPLEKLRRDSERNDGMVLTLALSYGGREELVAVAQRVAEEAAAGKLEPAEVTESMVESMLWTRELPALDLVIRTSGETRLSNFLLWQSAYAELYFTETSWPDFTPTNFLDAIFAFQGRQRRFGLTSPAPNALFTTAP